MFPDTEVNNELGAEGFAFYWIAAVDWGYATRDSTLARSLFSPSCTQCAEFMLNFDIAKRDDLAFTGGHWTYWQNRIADNDGSNGATYAEDMTVAISALQVTDAAGNVVESDPAVPSQTYRVWMAWTARGWSVVAWKQVIYH